MKFLQFDDYSVNVDHIIAIGKKHIELANGDKIKCEVLPYQLEALNKDIVPVDGEYYVVTCDEEGSVIKERIIAWGIHHDDGSNCNEAITLLQTYGQVSFRPYDGVMTGVWCVADDTVKSPPYGSYQSLDEFTNKASARVA